MFGDVELELGAANIPPGFGEPCGGVDDAIAFGRAFPPMDMNQIKELRFQHQKLRRTQSLMMY